MVPSISRLKDGLPGMASEPSLSTASADFEEADTPGLSEEVKQAFRSIGDVYPQVCDRIAAEDPEFNLAHEWPPSQPE